MWVVAYLKVFKTAKQWRLRKMGQKKLEIFRPHFYRR